MKKFLILIPVLLSLLLFSACGGGGESYEIKDKVFSSFAAKDLDGNILDESVFSESKVTMINVWATYCEPCKDEIPALNEICQEYNSADFQIIGIPIDGNRGSSKDARGYLAALGGVSYKNIEVSSSVKPLIDGIGSIPYTIFLNSDGYQIGGAYMGSKSKKEWKKVIDGILNFVNSQLQI